MEKIERSVIFTKAQMNYISDISRLTGYTKSQIIRIAVVNLWDLTRAMESVNGNLDARDVRNEFDGLVKLFETVYNNPNGGC